MNGERSANSEDKEEDVPFQMGITKRKLQKTGNSITMTIPPDWLKQHNLKEGDEITLLMNSDLKVLSPESKKQFYENAFKKEIENIE